MLNLSRYFTAFSFAMFFLFVSACNKGEDKPQVEQQESLITSTGANKETVSYSVVSEPITKAKVKEKEEQTKFSWFELSGWHTQGAISRNSPVRIVFNRDIVTDDQVGKDAGRVMKVSPAIAGNPVFKSKAEIVWLPSKSLAPDTEYNVSIKANGLLDVPVSEKDYEFSFRVVPMEYEIKTDALFIPPSNAENKIKTMTLNGELLVSDRVLPDNVRKVLQASYQGKSVKIDWQHSDNGRRHRFTLKDLKHEPFATDVQLKWSGESLGIKTKGKKEITLPGLNDFKIIDLRVQYAAGDNPYVQINFSDELKPSQNLNGLIQLEKKKYKVRAEGNVIKLYPTKNLNGEHKVIINKGLKGAAGGVLAETLTKKITFDTQKPQLRFVGAGSILPEGSVLEIPFEAVGIDGIKVTAFEIYPDKMGQFLQVNSLNGKEETERVGRFLWQKEIPLSSADSNKWNRYSFDVTELMKDHEGGLVRLNLQIKRRHSTYACDNKVKSAETRPTLLKNTEDNNIEQSSGWDGVSDYVEENEYAYNWEQRNNPCTDAYFNRHKDKTRISHNFIMSNIGLLAKQDANEKLHIITTDLKTSAPLAGAQLEVLNYQGQVLAKGQSDSQGFASLTVLATPFLLKATKGVDTNYLKLNAKTALSVSQFNTGGANVNNGIKGMVYAERGVWRPGDDIYLTFIVEDKDNKIPDAHPVTMKLFDPQGRLTKTQTSSDAVGGFYTFKFKTNEKAATGKWMAKAYLGGSTFSKSLMIETIRPNRLKVELDFGTDVLHGYRSLPLGTLTSQWLHGATAENLKADISVRFRPKKTKFDSRSDYNFDDPVRHLASVDEQLLKGRLDSTGKLRFTKFLAPDEKAAGKLRAIFTNRVFEQSGAFSINRIALDYHPYKEYVGIKLPKGDEARNMLLTDTQHTIKIASINADGKPVSMKQVQVTLYKIGWKWWWDKSWESLAEYNDSKHHSKLAQDIISTTEDGTGIWQFAIKYPEWGRYLVRACDLDGGHCTGKTVYVDWPGWAGRAQEEGSGSASRLNFFADKPTYAVGEIATIKLPESVSGRALLSVETGSRILKQEWIEFAGKRRKFELPITAEMSPNVYVHITLLQPHKGKDNDRPLRLYGIIPLEVADPKTYLKPIIEAAEEWKPESIQTVRVSEESGKAMSYTLAVVDEGLLGLTSFKTPNLHRHFYRKEALGIKTWDLYDQVIGAYSGNLNKMIALGGSDDGNIDNDSDKKRRFPPIVKVLGPFHLGAGKHAEHEVTLPPYVGAVRVMLVAAEKGAYGKAKQSIFVRKPLIMQATLPRVLGPNEEVSVPIALFVMKEGIKDVKLEIIADDFFDVVGAKSKIIHFDKIGEKLGMLRLKTKNKAGKGHIQFIATSGKHKTTSDVTIEIRQANQPTTRTSTGVIEPGASWTQKIKPHGLQGSNQTTLELSSVPSLNMEKHLDYLVRYPHGCLEQTTSSVFPQLYLSNVMQLNEDKQKEIEHHIKRAIERLRGFQLATGNFSYWSNGNHNNEWASVYAGHFLIEAQKLGYLLPAELLTDWLDYQANTAQRWLAGSNTYAQTQAYRLNVLALAGKPQIGAMNRLRESGKLSLKARWMLASAYQIAGQPEAANSLTEGLRANLDSQQRRLDTPATFSSKLGDLGLQLSNLIALNKTQDANKFVEKIAAELKNDGFQSTQGIAWALMAVSRYLSGDTSHFSAKYTIDSQQSNAINSSTPFSQKVLNNIDRKGSDLEVKNTSGSKLYASVMTRGLPRAGHEKSVSRGLKLQVSYTDMADSTELDLQGMPEVTQGTDIAITVDITNTSNAKVENIALTLPVAAGWEINNANYSLKSDKDKNYLIINQFDYQDVRDDRVYSYFSLDKKQSKTFRILVNASYSGRYYLPAISASAMYNGDMQARKKGQWITITKVKAVIKSKKDEEKAKTAEAEKQEERIVQVKKAWLYDTPKADDITTLYLIEKDKFTVLEQKAVEGVDWYFIRFIGVKIIEKWIKASDTKEDGV